MKNFFLFLMIFSPLLSCSRDDNEEPVEQQDNMEIVFMSNPTDPMFAVAKTDTSHIEFYGERDVEGIPSKLDLIIIKTPNDTISYSFDDMARPLIVQTNTGFEYKYDWKNDTDADVVVTTPDGQIITAPISLAKSASSNKSYGDFKSSVSNKSLSENITVNVISCGNPVTSSIGQVGIDYYTNIGSQKVEYLPAKFINGNYVASLPQTVTTTLFSTPVLLNKIVEVMSDACKLKVPGADEAFMYACLSISSILAATGVGSAPALAITTACIAIQKSFSLYCKLVNKPAQAAIKLGKVTWEKRIYNESISLRPYALQNGKKVMGELTSTIGGNQRIDLRLNLGCIDKLDLLCSGTWIQFENNHSSLNAVELHFTFAKNGTLSITGHDAYGALNENVKWKFNDTKTQVILYDADVLNSTWNIIKLDDGKYLKLGVYGLVSNSFYAVLGFRK